MRKIVFGLANNIAKAAKASSYNVVVKRPWSWCNQQAFLQVSQANFYQAKRTMSGDKKIDLTYQDLLDVKAKGGVILVDVREHNEIQETGKLPDSIHIPLGELQQALQSSPEDFKSKYEGADQPSKDADLIFSCRGGVRSRKAMTAAQEIGFNNVRHYAGGWLDWEANTKK